MITRRVIIVSMIRSFASKDTERLFNREISRKIPPNIQRRARIKLLMINAAEKLEDLRIPPSNNLEKLTGNRAGQHSIRINNQWRICFYWQDGDAFDVEIVDYNWEN